MTVIETVVTAGLVGAIAASLSGRERTRIDNLLIGGVFTAFAAYRDPRSTPQGTVLVALGEGLLWGLTDRLAPTMKELVMPSAESAEA